MRSIRMLLVSTTAAVLFAGSMAGAQPARKAYKHVDEHGRVTYSQTPIAHDAKEIDLPPPRLAPSRARDYEREAIRRQANEDRRAEYERRRRERQEAREEARQKRVDALRAECNRNRGTDCDNLETLRLIEAKRHYRPYRPRVRRNK